MGVHGELVICVEISNSRHTGLPRSGYRSCAACRSRPGSGPDLLARFGALLIAGATRSFFYGDTEETLAALKGTIGVAVSRPSRGRNPVSALPKIGTRRRAGGGAAD